MQERVNNDVTRRNTDSIEVVDLLGYLWKREDKTRGAGGAGALVWFLVFCLAEDSSYPES